MGCPMVLLVRNVKSRSNTSEGGVLSFNVRLQEFNLLVALIMKNDNVGNSDDLNKHFE